MANLSEDIQCAGFDTRPPMLDRTDFASWQHYIRLYFWGKENRVNILKSIDEGPFQMGTFWETLAEGNGGALHLGLPKDIYTLINHYTDAKDIWDNVKMLLEGLSPTDNLIENLTNTLTLLTQSYKTYLPQTNNQLRTSLNTRNQATVQDGRVVVQNVQGRQNKGQGNNAWGAGTTGYGGSQNRVGNENPCQARQINCYICNGKSHIARNCTQPKQPQNSKYFKNKMLLMQAQKNRVALDEEQLLFIAGGQDNVVDEDVDEQPVQDLALNVDNVFQADDCDAFDSDVDEAPTAQTTFMANLSSADPVYDEVGPSYDSDILSKVHDHDHYQDAVCEHHEVHEMHDDVQLNYVVDSHVDYTSDSNMILYDQYVKDNAVPDPVQYASVKTQNNAVDKSLTAEFATYKLYERRTKFELTEREQKINEQLRIVITDRNIKEENLKKELHSVKMQLTSTINHNKSMVDEVSSLKKDFKQKENKYLEEFLDMKALKEKDLIKVKAEALKEQTTASRPIKALTVYAIDYEPIPPCSRNNKEVHLDYLKHPMESVATIREIVEEAKVERLIDRSLESACLYTKHSQELLEYVIGTCLKDVNNQDKKQASTPLTRKQQVTFEDQFVTSNNNAHKHVEKMNIQKTNVPMIPSTEVDDCTDASGSQPKSNTKKNRISTAKSVNKKKVEERPRTTKSSLKTSNRVDSSISSKRTVIQIILWYFDSGCSKHMTGDCSRLRNFIKQFIGIIRFGNDHFGAIMGYGDYVIGDSVIFRVYYVEGLGHNLFSIRQFCDSNLEVAFRKHSCYVRDTDGVELVKGSRGSNLYTISVEDMMKSSPICLLSKASKNKLWLWHCRLNNLNFSTINDLARKDLVRGLPRLKFKKGHLFSAYQLGKSKKHSHTPKTKNTNLEVLNTLHMDLCRPISVSSAPTVPVLVNSAGTPSSTTINQNALSRSHLPSSSALESLCSHQGVVARSTIIEDNPFAPVDNDSFVNLFAPKPSSEASSSEDVSLAESTYVTQTHHHLGKWSKDYPLDNVIGNPS
ncbi:integrase, catalytic region, zinc finger, CCHC-type containing protein [Tanacetum coccineum]